MRLEVNDISDLRPVIKQVVQTVLDEIRTDEAKLDHQLAYSEPEAAGLIGVARHVLADARRRGEIKARKVGKQYRYSRQQLLSFLEDSDG